MGDVRFRSAAFLVTLATTYQAAGLPAEADAAAREAATLQARCNATTYLTEAQRALGEIQAADD